MTTLENQPSVSERIGLWLRSSAMWIITIALASIGFLLIQDIVFHVGARVVAPEVETIGTVRGRGTMTVIRNVTAVISGLLWLIIIIGTMEIYFKHPVRALRVFKWMVGIQVAIILVWFLIFEFRLI